ncbi:MAG: isoleucine--tRNA ligase [Candidatus Diapherotrites archaeon]
MAVKKPLEPYTREKEAEVKNFWDARGIAEKARKQNRGKKEQWYMMDGPPYATGHIHMGTALNKVLKDCMMRAKRMRGFDVFDRAGYDTHGVPIEYQIEKELGTKNRKDIEKFGVGNFVRKCREFATRFIGTQNGEYKMLGVWMDWENPYLTLRNEYIEAVWWTFKSAEEKGLLYRGQYPVHICPRCETAVAYNEIEYTKLSDMSVYVKYKIKERGSGKENGSGARNAKGHGSAGSGQGNRYFIIWTTTPWTLPGNTGIMVHPNYEYAEVELSSGEHWILAKELLQGIMDAAEAGYREVKVWKGSELAGTEYEEALAEEMQGKKPELKGMRRVVPGGRYVNLDAGTGLVHTAPGHGREDYEVGKENGLPALCPVGIDGILTAEAGKYAGGRAREIDAQIIADLEAKGALVYKHPYTHDYPLCWRCKTPLLMVSIPQWFFKISDIQKRALALNKKVNWVPAFMGDRMQNWLESIGDWPVSRQRYWGTPLPIWVCENEKCGARVVVGSMKELGKLAKLPKNLGLHKPEIDDVVFKCKKCAGKMRRVPEVMDVWFDSGVSSWGALDYPLRTDLFKKWWPAEFNTEATDQFRGWWNSQAICSIICFDRLPYEAVMVHGMVLDVSKKKMSKSAGNVVQPMEVIEKYNVDYLRHYLVLNSKGADITFDWEAFRDIGRFFNTFWNTYNYVSIYLALDLGMKPAKGLEVEDEWILSKLNTLVREALDAYDGYVPSKAAALIERFVVDDLSRTYIKLVRERVRGKSGKAVEATLNNCIFTLLRLLSPITPHVTEYIYQHARSGKMPESVHLAGMPAVDKKMIDAALEKEMELAMALAQEALALREEKKLRLRWPLKELVVATEKGTELKKTKNILAKMVNVGEVAEQKKGGSKPKGEYAEKAVNDNLVLYLNIASDTQMREEWELMELRRRIQDARKQAGLMPQKLAELRIACSDAGFLKKYGKRLEKETNTKLVQLKGGKQEGFRWEEKLLEREFAIEVVK